jgi:hypothetical protein
MKKFVKNGYMLKKAPLTRKETAEIFSGFVEHWNKPTNPYKF